MIGGVDVFGGSERTTVEIGLGGATGAKDVVSARIAQASRVLMFMLSVRYIGDAHRSDAECSCLLLLQGKTTWFRAADCKAARKIDMGWPMKGLVVLWRPAESAKQCSHTDC